MEGSERGTWADQPKMDPRPEPEGPPAPTSRLCIKNLPKHAVEAKIKELFSSKGEVTDVKLLKTR
jgi:RNA recognition motif-containing protein